MAAIFSFKCSLCGKIHEGSPSFAFQAPDPYLQQSPEIKEAGYLTGDLCEYEDEDGMHHFVRVCLEVPIHGVSEPFLWGVRVSLSEKNFRRYIETYDNPDPNDRCFGWFCNRLPYCPVSYSLKAEVHPCTGGERLFIVLENTDHPLSVDFHQGISIQKAQEIAEAMAHR